eukprot:m.61024 g.61024  ORF g.61024 m.61024 type:complete len:79 (+) comp34967_c0_seq6:430-666(+)
MTLSYQSLQTFAIPGSIFLSILSGFLFNFPLALLLVCLVSGNCSSSNDFLVTLGLGVVFSSWSISVFWSLFACGCRAG